MSTKTTNVDRRKIKMTMNPVNLTGKEKKGKQHVHGKPITKKSNSKEKAHVLLKKVHWQNQKMWC
jgi:hypothetical protein